MSMSVETAAIVAEISSTLSFVFCQPKTATENTRKNLLLNKQTQGCNSVSKLRDQHDSETNVFIQLWVGGFYTQDRIGQKER